MSIVWSYHERSFRAEGPDPGPFAGEKLLFKFSQDDRLVRGDYNGSDILDGVMLGTLNENGVVELGYQHLTRGRTLVIGMTKLTPEILEDGRYRVVSEWEHIGGAHGSGVTVLVQTD